MEIILHHDVKNLLLELNEFGNSMIFGGYIRDRLLGLTPSDVDIVTNIPIEKIEEMFKNEEKASRRVTVSGHDVYSFKLERVEKIFVEIISVNYDLMKKPFEADYTINSFLHDGNKIIDLTNGLKDLNNKIIKEVDIDIIKTDLSQRPYLWLKTIRLLSMTGFKLSEKVLCELKENKKTIENISPSIFQTEGHKTMNGKFPLNAMNALISLGYITDYDDSNKSREIFVSIQPHQKLCFLTVISSKKTIDDFIKFYQFPQILNDKYNELYEAYYSKNTNNRLRHQVRTLNKLLEG